ncbi:26S proteasome non-ATPase regulatory subunit 7 [Cichlidogyrus casuarinus]|uniref:26S proteasome non-ATPase regulatory subunit 7 n=1 Tax=Cichlidogyrus casuarinus TaxID=1844966 RepID=A0ABD2QGM7_9PLAT
MTEKTETIVKKVEGLRYNKVVVHPLVLLGVVDHFNRLGKVTSGQRRVIGVLLGSSRHGVLDVSNSFAVPFEEDSKDDSVWYLDHDYLESMFSMFKKVNARERIVGWYHSGPKLYKSDIKINELFRKYVPSSVLVVVDVGMRENDGLPTEAYIAVEEVHDDGSPTSKTFEHLPSEIGAEESEEVGVEHLLRDIKDTSLGSLSQRIGSKLEGLGGLHHQLSEIKTYLELILAKKLPMNHPIIYHLQNMMNLLPDIKLNDLVRSLHVSSNDQMLVLYVSSVIRSILALHDLITNKLTNRDLEKVDTDIKKGDVGEKKADAGDGTTPQATKPSTSGGKSPSRGKK